jgi:hypothetical protein
VRPHSAPVLPKEKKKMLSELTEQKETIKSQKTMHEQNENREIKKAKQQQERIYKEEPKRTILDLKDRLNESKISLEESASDLKIRKLKHRIF